MVKEEQVSEDSEVFDQLSNVLGYGVRYKDKSFDSASSEVVKKLVPLANCKDCDLLMHSNESVKKNHTGWYREDPEGDAKEHAERYGHTVEFITDEGEEYYKKVFNDR